MPQSIDKLENRIDKLEKVVIYMAGANMMRLTKKEFKDMMVMLKEILGEAWFRNERLQEIIKEEE